MFYVECGYASHEVEITATEWRNLNTVPCTAEGCPGDVDLMHARRHVDIDTNV